MQARPAYNVGMRTRVYLSLAEGDARLGAPLIEHLRRPFTGLVLIDPGMKGRFHDPGAQLVRDALEIRIGEVQVIACLIGPAAHRDPWIDWEVDTARTAGRGIVAIRLRLGTHDFIPRAVRHSGAQIVEPHLASVIASLERAAFTAGTRQPGNK